MVRKWLARSVTEWLCLAPHTFPRMILQQLCTESAYILKMFSNCVGNNFRINGRVGAPPHPSLEVRIVVVGLDNSGKTTVLNALRLGSGVLASEQGRKCG